MMPTSKMNCYSALTRFERAMEKIKTIEEWNKLYRWYRVIKRQLYNNKMDIFAEELRDNFMFVGGRLSNIGKKKKKLQRELSSFD